ncbi:hypothetical protein EVAR_5769_1 [Eumeta japonica]|uniref:Uncharacterized protein n=1 Tax=Eumeta variegata TaxID=151549 RepID=A0A4C1T4A7_EUMVA|nr:hypothetical protein EVAR_5769_1 [Eumeta japonica]
MHELNKEAKEQVSSQRVDGHCSPWTFVTFEECVAALLLGIGYLEEAVLVEKEWGGGRKIGPPEPSLTGR